MADNYFDHPYCSNSALTKLGRQIGFFREIDADIEEAYRLGSLFDAVVTEPDKIDLIRKRIIGTDYYFTDEEYSNSKAMHSELKKNQLYSEFLKCNPQLQKEIYAPSLVLNHEGFSFAISMKAKLDFFVPGIVADLKSTACTSQRAFEAAFVQFGYHRQMVNYCRLTGTGKAIVFAVSKVNKKVFVVTMKYGDALWRAGDEQLNMLAFKYYLIAS